MPKVVILPHQNLCPDGAVLGTETDETILDVALRSEIEIEYACEESRTCTTCHCIMRKDFDSPPENTEEEDDILGKVWGLRSESRLSCQAWITEDDLVAEIPRYAINHVHER